MEIRRTTDASDPHADSTGKLTTRDPQSSSFSSVEGAAAALPSTPDEIAWLIERHIASKLHYWTGETRPNPWTTDPNRALRFSRQTDANCMLTWHCEDNGRVVQHLWMGATALPRETEKGEPPPTEVWLLFQRHDDGRDGLRGVHPTRERADAEMQMIMVEHPDLRRDDFIFQVERIRIALAREPLKADPISESPTEDVAALRRAIGNCYMMAKREIARHLNHSSDEINHAVSIERWQHVQRFCESVGEKSSILRWQLPTEITDGAGPSPLQRGSR